MTLTSIGAHFDFRLLEYVVECNRRNSLPNMIFIIGDRKFQISAYEYLYAVSSHSINQMRF